MKRFLCIAVSVITVLSCLVGCGENGTNKNGKISIVATTFPSYDWTREILGDNIDNVNLTLLLDNGVDLHSYQPTAKDIVTISSCDLFIYVGGESDEWVDDALKEASNEDMHKIALLNSKYALTEETVEGMEAEGEEGEEEEEEYDEHIWLSLERAKTVCSNICAALSEIDPDNADMYSKNASAYSDKLEALNKEYKTAVKNGNKDTLLFADRFPFRYLTDDYNLKYYAAFKGCSAESEASFKTISFLASKVKELKLSSVIALEGSDKKIAKTVIRTSKEKNVSIVTLDSMQTTTSKDVKNGKTYLSIAKSNLKALKKALE